jgi:hypothetical protein
MCGVKLNEAETDVPTVLQLGEATASVTVSAGGAELVGYNFAQSSKDFSSRQVVDLAQSAHGRWIYNLALISPNVVSLRRCWTGYWWVGWRSAPARQ